MTMSSASAMTCSSSGPSARERGRRLRVAVQRLDIAAERGFREHEQLDVLCARSASTIAAIVAKLLSMSRSNGAAAAAMVNMRSPIRVMAPLSAVVISPSGQRRRTPGSAVSVPQRRVVGLRRGWCAPRPR